MFQAGAIFCWGLFDKLNGERRTSVVHIIAGIISYHVISTISDAGAGGRGNIGRHPYECDLVSPPPNKKKRKEEEKIVGVNYFWRS